MVLGGPGRVVCVLRSSGVRPGLCVGMQFVKTDSFWKTSGRCWSICPVLELEKCKKPI